MRVPHRPPVVRPASHKTNRASSRASTRDAAEISTIPTLLLPPKFEPQSPTPIYSTPLDRPRLETAFSDAMAHHHPTLALALVFRTRPGLETTTSPLRLLSHLPPLQTSMGPAAASAWQPLAYSMFPNSSRLSRQRTMKAFVNIANLVLVCPTSFLLASALPVTALHALL